MLSPRVRLSDEAVGDALMEHHLADIHLEQLSKAFVALGESKSLNFRDCYLALQGEKFSESFMFKKVEQTVKFLSTDVLKARLTVMTKCSDDPSRNLILVRFVTFSRVP